MTRAFAFAGIIALCFIAPPRPVQAQTGKLQGKTYRSPGGTTLRLMLDENNVGGEVTLGEMVFPANTDSGDLFGYSVGISGDTMVVAAPGEASNATGIEANRPMAVKSLRGSKPELA